MRPSPSLALLLAACTGAAPDDGPDGDTDTDVPVDTAPPVDTDWVCGPDDQVCDGVCRAVRFDELACGSCGTVCDADHVCDEGACVERPVASACDDAKRAEVLAEATKDAPTVTLDCSLSLSSDDVITKRVLLLGPASSGVTLDCGGGTLRKLLPDGGSDLVTIQSLKTGPATWERPTDITLRNCVLEGAVRIRGQGINGEDEDVRADSQTPGHRERAQQAAPTRVLLDALQIVGDGRIPLYLAPGTTEVTLQRSTITGRSVSTVVYLDAESAHNALVGNVFDLDEAGREVIAIDGSADNVVAGNTLAPASAGGVFVYRNCGEGGTVRHQKPRRNLITGNVIDSGSGLAAPAVWVGSRGSSGLFPGFCDLDDGLDFGSSESDEDFANHTVIAGNRFAGKVPDPPTLVSDEPVLAADNEASDTRTPGPVSCALFRDAAAPRLVADGQTAWGRRCEGGRWVPDAP